MNGWEAIWESREMLLSGLVGTIVISVIALVTSTAIGTIVGVLRSRHIVWLEPILRVYIEIFRGSPLLVQLLLIYFGAS